MEKKQKTFWLKTEQIVMLFFLFSAIVGVVCIAWNYQEKAVFIVNIVYLAIVFAGTLCCILNRKIRRISIWMIIISITLLITINKLYLKDTLEGYLPWVKNISTEKAILGMIVTVILCVCLSIALWIFNLREKAKKETVVNNMLQKSMDNMNKLLERLIETIVSVVILGGIIALTYYLFKEGTIINKEKVGDVIVYVVGVVVIAFAIICIWTAVFSIPKMVKKFIKEYSDIEKGKIFQRAFPHMLCIVLTSIAFFIVNKIGAVSAATVTEVLASSDTIAPIVAAIWIIVVFITVYAIFFWIISFVQEIDIAGSKARIKSDVKKILNEIRKIVVSIFEIVVNSINTILNFAKAIPDFFAELYHLVFDENDTTPIRIVKIASFAMALLSWFTTSEGLYLYVFEYAWQASLVSFGIQSILFVFNLKLPYYIRKRNEETETLLNDFNLKAEDEVASTVVLVEQGGMEYRKRKEQKNFEKGWKINWKVAGFYTLLLVTSSIFSFVYISNQVYADTMYTDADSWMEKNYRNYIDTIEDYVQEEKQNILLLINQHLIALLGEDDEPNDELKNTLEELGLPGDDFTGGNLERAKLTLESQKRVEEIIYNDAQADINDADAILTASSTISNAVGHQGDQNTTTQGYSPEALAVAQANKDAATIKKDQAYNNIIGIDKKINMVTNYSPGIQTTIRNFLTLLTERQPDEVKLVEYQTDLMSAALRTTQKDTSDIIGHVQQIAVLSDKYLLLTDVLKKNTNGNNVGALKNLLENSSIDAPIPSEYEISLEDSEDTERSFGEKLLKNMWAESKVDEERLNNDVVAWKEMWEERINVLENVLAGVPTHSEGLKQKEDPQETVTSDGAEFINMDVIEKYDSKEIADNLAKWKRNYLGNINDMERAFKNMYPYGVMAIFSFLFAFAVDLISLAAGVLAYTMGKKEQESNLLQASQREDAEE